MGVGKTERLGKDTSRFTKGRRIDASNDRILRNLRVHGGRLHRRGDHWVINVSSDVGGGEVNNDAAANNYGTMDAPDSEATSSQKSLAKIPGTDIWQIEGFNANALVASGLTEILKADPVTGTLSADTGQQYEILVRVKSSDGTFRAIGYMPFGQSNGADPVPAVDTTKCQHESVPGGGGAADALNGVIGPRLPPGGTDGSNRDSEEGSARGEFPSKIGPCW